MHKKLFLISIVMLIAAGSLFSGERARMDAYLNAVNEKDPAVKIERLEAYLQEYGQEQDKYLGYVYIQLCDTSFIVKKYDSAITYGEKALTVPDIAEGNKLRILFLLANSCQAAKKDPEKALLYSQSMMELSNAIIEKTRAAEIDEDKKVEFIKNQKKYYIAGAYRIQALLLFDQINEKPELVKDAALKAVEAYRNDPNDNMFRMVLMLANKMYQKKNLKDAIAVVENLLSIDPAKITEKIANFLAAMHYQNGTKDIAISYYEKAYQARRTADTALKIGKLVYKTNIDKGIDYFADAFVMSNLDKASDAYKYLQELYYNRKAKDLPSEAQEKGFHEIVQASRARVSHSGGSSAPTDQN